MRLVALVALLVACTSPAPREEPTAPPERAGAPVARAPLGPPPTLQQRPAELVAAADLAGVFPLPEGARFERRAGRLGLYRLTAAFPKVVHFYRAAGFVVTEKEGAATVVPPKRSRDQEFLVIRHRFGEVVNLVVHEGARGEPAPAAPR